MSNEVILEIPESENDSDECGYFEGTAATHEIPFTQIPNKLLNNDYELSAEALGVICYLLHHKRGFTVWDKTIEKKFDMGRDKRQKIFKELKEKGFVKKFFRKDPNGKIRGWRALYSNYPEFLVNNQKPEKPVSGEYTTSLKTNPLVLPPRSFSGCINNTKEENNTKKTTTEPKPLIDAISPPPAPEAKVVVSLKDCLIDKLEKLGIREPTYKSWFESYPISRIEGVLDVSKRKGRDPAAYVVAAMNGNWVINDKVFMKSSPGEPPKRFTREENVQWWLGLTLDDRKDCLSFFRSNYRLIDQILSLSEKERNDSLSEIKATHTKKGLPYDEDMFSWWLEETYLDDKFHEHDHFKALVEMLGRKENGE